jgi:hypothetical protein
VYEAGEVSDASLPPYDHHQQQLQQHRQQVQQQKDDQQWQQQQEQQQQGYVSPRRTRLSLSPQKGQGQGGVPPLLDGSYVVVDSEALLEEYRAHEQQERDYEQQQQQ